MCPGNSYRSVELVDGSEMEIKLKLKLELDEKV